MAEVISRRSGQEDVKELRPLPRARAHDRFVRESDVVAGGRRTTCGTKRRPRAVPGSQGTSKVSLLAGIARTGGVVVRHPGRPRFGDDAAFFELLRRRSNAETLEIAANTTGVSAEMIRKLGRRWRSRSCDDLRSTVACQHYHSDLMHRAVAPRTALTAMTASRRRPRFAHGGTLGFDSDLGLGETPALQEALMKLTGRLCEKDMEAYMTERRPTVTTTPAPVASGACGYADVPATPITTTRMLGMEVVMKRAIEGNWIRCIRLRAGIRKSSSSTPAIPGPRPSPQVAESTCGPS